MQEENEVTEQSIPERLLDILACPACDTRPKVKLIDGSMHCPSCGRVYPVENGVPVMLIERATMGNDAKCRKETR